MLDPSFLQQGLTAAVVGLLTWTTARAVYNIFLSPLAKYPGPTFAAASTWWKVYIEVIKRDSLALVLVRLHERYGKSAITLGHAQSHIFAQGR